MARRLDLDRDRAKASRVAAGGQRQAKQAGADGGGPGAREGGRPLSPQPFLAHGARAAQIFALLLLMASTGEGLAGPRRSAYDAGGLDGSSEARLCSGADVERDQGLTLPDCEWSKHRGRSLIIARSTARWQPALRPAVADLDPELDRIAKLGVEDLRAVWRERRGQEPPEALSKDLIARALAHWLQEKCLGGLAPHLREFLASISEKGAGPVRRVKVGSVIKDQETTLRGNVATLKSWIKQHKAEGLNIAAPAATAAFVSVIETIERLIS